MINFIYVFYFIVILLCLSLILFEPPHLQAEKASANIQANTAGITRDDSYFRKLAQITTTTTSTTTTTTAPTVQTSPYKVSYPDNYITEIIRAFFPENPDLWISIAQCESGLNPNAFNSEGASGLFQIMMPLHKDMLASGENIFDPVVNARIARSISRNGTSTIAWVSSKGCWS